MTGKSQPMAGRQLLSASPMRDLGGLANDVGEAAGVLLELAAAALGAHFGGLLGLSLSWVVAVCFEVTWMSRIVYRAVRPATRPTLIYKLQVCSSDQEIRQLHAPEPGLVQ